MSSPDPGDRPPQDGTGEPADETGAGEPATETAADAAGAPGPTGDPGPASDPQPAAGHQKSLSDPEPPPTSPSRGNGLPRWSRRKRVLAWLGAITTVIVVAAALGVYGVYRHLNGNVHQLNISGIIGTQPVNHHPRAENILVIGSDTRYHQGRGYGSSKVLSTDQSDTLLIVHIAADRKWADVMSIPRDSWVNIPSCRMGNGQMSTPTTFKINEAFAIGNLYGNNTDLGVACTIKTVEANTGIPINHFVAVNFAGFRAMVNALGGVPECNTAPINDPKSGLHLAAGHHLLLGWRALAYVRARYTLGNGSDLERIGRQQAFMSSLIERVKSKLLNPVAIYRFLDAATRSLTVDSAMGGLPGLYNMATSVRNMQPSQVTFFTLPTYPRSQVVPTDTANVMWTQPEDSMIFQAFRNDVPVTAALLHQHRGRPGISPGSVSLAVVNGTPNAGLQDSVASQLQQDGFHVVRTGTSANSSVTETVIRYHSGQFAQSRLLASKIHGAALIQVSGSGQISLLLGSNYGTTANPGPRVTPIPASSFAPRTASQNICTSA
jgi:LCP family protein required for cell wall assembly